VRRFIGCQWWTTQLIVCMGQKHRSISMIPAIVDKHVQGGVFCNQLFGSPAYALWINSPSSIESIPGLAWVFSRCLATTGDDDLIAETVKSLGKSI
jgi:hypothetical protein